MNIIRAIKYRLNVRSPIFRSRKDIAYFRCNLCGRNTNSVFSKISREEVSCRCGSTVRLRSLVHVLSLRLFGESYAIPDIPVRPDLVGVDMSGASNLASRLAERIGYTNTFLHKEPFLDIVNPTSEWFSRCDFVISSDVFEHVETPVSRAFENTMRLLKPGGIFVLTVPYRPEGDTVEHFPELNIYHIEESENKKILVNKKIDGSTEIFEQLVFHGGDGDTLEMRVFSESGVLRELENAGFVDIRVHREPCEKYGIYWPQEWSLPISGRRPLF